MKKITLFLFLMCCVGIRAQTVTIGTGTSTNYKGPITSFWDYGATEMIYTGSELNNTGNITSIGWYVATAATQPCNPVYIYMKTTSATSLASGTTPYPASTGNGYTLVYTGTGHDNATGWQNIVLDTPFPFNDASQNLQILCVNLSGEYWTQYPEYRYTNTVGYQCAVYYSNTLWQSGVSNLTPSTQRYNVQVTFSPASTAPAVSSFSPAVPCAGSTVTITGSGFTGATAVTVGGTPVTSFTVNSATQITATVGGGMSGTIMVTTPSGSGQSASMLEVSTTPPPVFPDDAPILCHEIALNGIAPPDSEVVVWYAAATGGSPIAGTTVVSDGSYFAAQVMNGCESVERAQINVSINHVDPPTGDAVQNICNAGTVGDLEAEGATFWYDAATGGNMLAMNMPLTNMGMYYASRSADGCESQERLPVQALISFAAINMPGSVAACDSYILPELEYGHYFTEPGGTGTMVEEGTEVTEDTTLYIYADDFSNPECTAEAEYAIYIHTASQLSGDHVQIIEADTAEEATVSDLVVTGTDGYFLWYFTYEDAMDGVNPVSPDEQLVDGHEYFAVHTVGDCSAEPYGVTANVMLGTGEFGWNSFTYSPNPVKDILKLSHPVGITALTVYNMLGQAVLTASPNVNEAALDMSGLASGTYIVKVKAGDSSKTIKIAKQ